MSEGGVIVALSTTVEDQAVVVVGVFGPYESKEAAGDHTPTTRSDS
jgi:hypothetical protein